MTHEVRALGYVRVSLLGQADRAPGRAAQEAAIRAEAGRRGWPVEILSDVASSARTVVRPGLAAALRRLDAAEAQVLLVSRLDRLARDLGDLAALAERARDRGWRIVSADIGLDTGTPAGEFVAGLLTATASGHPSLVAERTREALAARKAAGVRLGRPADVPADVVARVVAERRAGRSLVAIAQGLDADGVPTARGGLRWYPTTVAKLLQSQQARGL